MKETTNKKLKYTTLEVEDVFRIGIKFNEEMVKLLAKRIKQAEESGRGLNILMEGNLKRGFGEIESEQGNEYSYTLYDEGEIRIFDWDPSKAYNGRHKFWLEGFVKKKK